MVDDRAAGADEGTGSLVGWWREWLSVYARLEVLCLRSLVKAEFVFESKHDCSWLAVYARVEVRVLRCRLEAISARDGKGFRIWSQMQMVKLHYVRIGLSSRY